MSSLQRVLDVHDEDPALAAAMLKTIIFNDLDDKQKNDFIWLVNHVVGELLSDWASAFDLLLSNRWEYSAIYFKFLACTAYCSARPVHAFAAEREYAELAGVSLVEAKVLVGLLCVQSLQGSVDIAQSISVLEGYVALLGLPSSSPVGKGAAAALNNIISKLIDDPRLQDDEQSHQKVIIDAAVACERLWMQFGTWLNHERSLYLCALTFNRFAQWRSALEVAGKALVIIDSNGVEEVDRAFLLLEASKAYQGLGNREKADEALHAADRIARDFDSQLSHWFLDVRSRLKVADLVVAD